ncbi:unnamed protein product [Citrullus colocynthis]|uniref:Uncharacterized protein n=1 Tax=Citrullus colocynthis TaxID=252529 RepID=A0ABP0Z374_9ROSI
MATATSDKLWRESRSLERETMLIACPPSFGRAVVKPSRTLSNFIEWRKYSSCVRHSSSSPKQNEKPRGFKRPVPLPCSRRFSLLSSYSPAVTTQKLTSIGDDPTQLDVERSSSPETATAQTTAQQKGKSIILYSC